MLRLLPLTLWQPAVLLPAISRAISGYQLYVKELKHADFVIRVCRPHPIVTAARENYEDVASRIGSKKMEEVSRELGASWQALSQGDKDDYKRKGSDIPHKRTPKVAPAPAKKPRSPNGYNLYVKERFATELPSISETGVAKRERIQGFMAKFGSEWKQLEETQKARYNEMAKRQKEE